MRPHIYSLTYILMFPRGYTSMKSRENMFVVDNAHDGFDLRDLPTGSLIRNFPTGRPTFRYPKQVVFGEGSSVVIGGSDHGSVYVFDRKSGALRQKLQHTATGAVQTVTVSRSIESTGEFIDNGEEYDQR